MSELRDSNIVESLKSTRNIYRLMTMLTLSAAIVFLTIEFSEDDKLLVEIVDELFDQHEQYVSHWTNEFFPKDLNPKYSIALFSDLSVAVPTKSTIDTLKMHIRRRFKPNRCALFPNIGSLNLNSAEMSIEMTKILRIDRLSLVANVESEAFYVAASRLLSHKTGTHWLSISPVDPLPCTEGRALHLNRITLTSVYDDGLEGSFLQKETISAEIVAKYYPTVMNHDAFITWFGNAELKHQGNAIGDGKLMPQIVDDDRELDFRALRSVLNERLTRGTFEGAEIAIRGLILPGSGILYAIPTAIVVLLYYFLGHVSQLSKTIMKCDRDLLEEFSWIPIAPKKAVRVKNTGGMSWGVLDGFFHVVIFPIIPSSILFVRFQMWESLGKIGTGEGALEEIIVICVVVSVSIGCMCLCRICAIRKTAYGTAAS